MRSLIGSALGVVQDRAPVPYAPRRAGFAGLFGGRTDTTAQLGAMAGNGTLYAIISRTATATAAVEWHLWRRARSGRKEDRVEVVSHAALDLWNNPNPHYTRQRYVEAGQQHIDLVGEGLGVVARSSLVRSIPLELWPVRPDRMTPVPSVEEFLAGWEYRAPDGETVPLDVEDVLTIQMPNPMDPYRGLGPVQAILADLDSSRYSAEWNRNFFINSAEPGGIVEVDRRLSEPEWQEMVDRWREQHQGVANAHRVAILEQGKWVERKITQRDMQFAELRNLSREVIREAFGFPKPLLGAVDDVNRANAEAGELVFARWVIVPRLERWKAMLNSQLLPLFGDTARDLEFDYDSPVPEDEEAENAERTSKASAAATLVGAGWDPGEVLTTVGLPPMRHTAGGRPAAASARLRLGDGAPVADLPTGAPPRNAAAEPDPTSAAMAAAHAQALDQLTADWQAPLDDQRADLQQQVEDAVDAGDVAALAALVAAATVTGGLLAAAAISLAATFAQAIVDEAAAQGVNVDPVSADEEALTAAAEATAAILAAGLAYAAGREALRVLTPDATGAEVARKVRDHLDALSDATLREQLGGTLWQAGSAGAAATMTATPPTYWRATEVLDTNTCPACREQDGTRMDTWAQVIAAGYASGGLLDCAGRWRCRGRARPIWEDIDG